MDERTETDEATVSAEHDEAGWTARAERPPTEEEEATPAEHRLWIGAHAKGGGAIG